MNPYDIVTSILLAVGCFVAISGGVGVLRMPDFYTRIHPAGKSDTLAQTSIMIALMVQAGPTLVSVKLALISLFLFITTPTATHAVARAAHVSGLKPWRPGDPRR
ncbi:MAG TPA: monovalent cation/H(+) antiporter subunit G [Acidiferrobacterales bacterium]|jgi:multicomponent Na+:H+ antiporter subunit G